jgi:hypothetical protein
MPTLQQWFCLKPNRDNFKLKVREDRNLILCHEAEIDQGILGSIEMRFAANEPIKMLIYGDWGVGKTHTAHHIGWWLDQNKATYPAKTVMIEVGDLDRRSKFEVLVRPFLEEIGLDGLVALSSDYLKTVGNVVQGLKKIGVPEYVATTISKFNIAQPGLTPPQVVNDAFQILQGRKPPSGGAAHGLGIQLTESKDLYYVLVAVGEMYRATKGHRLVFIADEAARLDEVENDEATLAHWIAVNRDIFDDANNTFGFIYTLTGKTNRLPRAIWEPQVQNRLGQNVHELKNLKKPDVEKYFEKLMDVLIDRTAVKQLVADGAIPSANYDEKFYPFAADAHAEFVDFFMRSQENSKPRDISERLNVLGFAAMKTGTRLITRESLRKANM